MRIINIPSGYEDLAAALIFTTDLKEGGLEISGELHVFCEDREIIEHWEVLGEHEETSSLPQNMLRSVEIRKVSIRGNQVSVALGMQLASGGAQVAVRLFDFVEGSPGARVAPYPFPSAPHAASA